MRAIVCRKIRKMLRTAKKEGRIPPLKYRKIYQLMKRQYMELKSRGMHGKAFDRMEGDSSVLQKVAQDNK